MSDQPKESKYFHGKAPGGNFPEPSSNVPSDEDVAESQKEK